MFAIDANCTGCADYWIVISSLTITGLLYLFFVCNNLETQDFV